MNSKHTPGPWKVQNNNGVPVTIESGGIGDGRVVTMLVDLFGDRHDDTTENAANARLIAAAPELLEAAMAYVNHVRGYHDTLSDGELEVLNLCQAAIAKATGQG